MGKYQCEICFARFVSEQKFSNHMELHSLDPVSCCTCGWKGIGYLEMETHLGTQNHTSQLLQQDIPAPPPKCQKQLNPIRNEVENIFTHDMVTNGCDNGILSTKANLNNSVEVLNGN